MPIYEFVCTACSRKSSFFTRSMTTPMEPVCHACGSLDMQRAISTFAHHRTVKDLHEAYGSPHMHLDADYYSNPRNIGRGVEDTFRQWDMEPPPEIRDAIDSAREGTMPEGIDL